MTGASPRESPEETRVQIIKPQPHGGALNVGGNWGNKGGGRAPSEIRKALRGAFADRVEALKGIADAAEKDSDRLKAMDLMAKYGLGKEIDTEDVKQRLRQTIDTIREVLPKEQADLVLKAIEPFWK